MSNNVDLIEKTINECSSEQRRLQDQFRKSMNIFATERSFESCLDALNISIQLTSVKGILMEAYENYSHILESEVISLRKICDKKNVL